MSELYFRTDVTPEELFQAIGKLRLEARREIDRLIRFLDETENHMAIDCEPCDDDGDGEDAEPSLGSFDRMTDQSKSWRQVSIWAFPEVDGEVDDCDREDCDPNEEKQQPPQMEPGADDELGMAWWNALTEQERARWSTVAGKTGRPKDAWEAFKRSQQMGGAA